MISRGDRELVAGALTRAVIGAFYDVHGELGFGFREYIYSLALERELVARGHLVEREIPITIYYRGAPLAKQNIDMVVDDRLIIETKATERLHSGATLQLFGYLCATNLEVGLVLHFGRAAQFHRVVCENRFKRRLPSAPVPP
jgi:GxxExxY protein